MRWHVHGTDAVTGEDVELAVNDQLKSGAVKAAIDRQILVSHVTRDGLAPLRRAGQALLYTALVALVAACAGLLAQTISLRGTLDQAISEQSRLAQSVALAEHTAADIRAHGNLAEAAAAQIQKLAEELTAARGRMSLTEKQLSAAHEHLSNLEQSTAVRLADSEKQVAALNEQIAAERARLQADDKLAVQLRAEMVVQGKRLEELEKLPSTDQAVAAQTATLEADNKALAAEMEKLKEQLLVAVAKANAGPAVPEEAAPAVAAEPWALRTTYEAARSFLTLHGDQDSFVTKSVDGTAMLASSAVLTENALRLRFTHDRTKEKIYSATLAVSLAADAPKEKSMENAKLVAEFLRTFVPGIREPEAILPAASAELAGLDQERRALFLAEDCRVTVWNNKAGLFTFQVEPAKDPAP